MDFESVVLEHLARQEAATKQLISRMCSIEKVNHENQALLIHLQDQIMHVAYTDDSVSSSDISSSESDSDFVHVHRKHHDTGKPCVRVKHEVPGPREPSAPVKREDHSNLDCRPNCQQHHKVKREVDFLVSPSSKQDRGRYLDYPASPPLAHPVLYRRETSCLPSSEIDKSSLLSVDEVVRRYDDKSPQYLGGKLALLAFYGPDVMGRCTPKGLSSFPGLPQAELYQIKQIVLDNSPAYWSMPGEYEKLWTTKIIASIGAICSVARTQTAGTQHDWQDLESDSMTE